MTDRRSFLKQFAAGAALLGMGGTAAFAHKREVALIPAGGRVVLARDPMVRDDFRELIRSRVEGLLDRAMQAYTGAARPAEAWRLILGNARRVSLKVNGVGGTGMSTHPVLVHAVAERLQHAGIRPEDIIIWDRSAADLEACGFTISTDSGRVRCFGSDMSGYEEAPESWGTVQVRLSKILTRESDLVIGIPVLRDDSVAGVTFAMKNMYGAIDRPEDLQANGCCPAIADLNCVPSIRNKVRFTIGDAFTAFYNGASAPDAEHMWFANALLVGEDRVAVDQSAWQMIDRKRAEMGLKSLAESGRSPSYISVAGDAAHNLGTDDPAKIHLSEV